MMCNGEDHDAIRVRPVGDGEWLRPPTAGFLEPIRVALPQVVLGHPAREHAPVAPVPRAIRTLSYLRVRVHSFYTGGFDPQGLVVCRAHQAKTIDSRPLARE